MKFWAFSTGVCVHASIPAPSLILLYQRIIVLKFANKVVFFEEIQDSYIPRKRGYFGTQLREFGEKRVNFDCQMFYCEKEGSFGLKSQYFTVKKGFILDWKVSVLSRKRDRFELKSQCFAAKKGDIFKLKNNDGYNFLQRVREPGHQSEVPPHGLVILVG